MITYKTTSNRMYLQSTHSATHKLKIIKQLNYLKIKNIKNRKKKSYRNKLIPNKRIKSMN